MRRTLTVLLALILAFGMVSYAMARESEDDSYRQMSLLLQRPRSLSPYRMRVALTFDDGPSVFTSALLDILEANHAVATFCVVGNRVQSFENDVRRASDMGCEIIGHSWDHAWLTHIDSDSIRMQLRKTQKVIESVTGKPAPMLYRPPYGATSNRLLDISRQEGFALIKWSLATGDTGNHDVKHIYNEVVYGAHDGIIILCHDIYSATVKAMRKAIPELIRRGYELVTVSDLMASQGVILKPGDVYKGR